MMKRLDGWVERKFPKTHRILHTEAQIVHLLKATVPLWLITVLACGVGFFTVIHDRIESCHNGRADVVEFVNRITALRQSPPTPAQQATLDSLYRDYVNDCG